MIILFLDIDGVLNNQQFLIDYYNLHGTRYPQLREYIVPILAQRLTKLVNKYDLYIVLSSSWRIGESLQSLKDIFDRHDLPSNRLIGKTPILKGSYDNQNTAYNQFNNSIYNTPRGREITTWLRKAKDKGIIVDKFIVIDDDSDAGVGLYDFGKYFQTTNQLGLTDEIINQIEVYLEQSS